MKFVSFETFVFIDCQLTANLKSSAVNTSSFSVCFSGSKGVSETLPFKIFREVQVALFLNCGWCRVCRETKDNYESKVLFSKRLKPFKFKEVTFIGGDFVINNKLLNIASGKFDTF